MERILKQWASNEKHELAKSFFNQIIHVIELENEMPNLFAKANKSLRKVIEADVNSLSSEEFFTKHYPSERESEANRVLFILDTYDSVIWNALKNK